MGRRVSSLCQTLKDMITDTLLSLKLPGEEYSKINNGLQSTILGKQESRELSLLAIRDGDARFQLPYLDDSALDNWLGNVSEVGVEVCTCKFVKSF